MNNLICLIQELQSLKDWKELIVQFLKNEPSKDDSSFKKVSAVLDEIQEQYKTDKKISNEIKNILGEDISILVDDFVSENLEWFFDLELLREIDKNDNDQVEPVIKIIFNEYVLNIGVDPVRKIMGCLNLKKDVTTKSVINMLQAIDFFVYKSIADTIDKEHISITLQNNADLSDRTSDLIASNIYDSRIELKLNLIIKKLNKQEE